MQDNRENKSWGQAFKSSNVVQMKIVINNASVMLCFFSRFRKFSVVSVHKEPGSDVYLCPLP